MLTLAPFTAPADVGANVTLSVVDCPGVRVVPFGTPVVLKPAPETVIPEMVTFEFPLFVSDVVKTLLVSSFTFPNGRLVGFALSRVVVAAPVPVRLIARSAGDPFVAIVIDPVALPLPVGAKRALKVRLAPAAIVVDVEIPVTLIPVPVTSMFENPKVMFPLFFTVIGTESVVPTATLPKLTVVGFAEPSASMPVPLSPTVVTEVDALLVMDRPPAALPSAVGVKVTVNVFCAPALTVAGVARFVVYGPLALAEEILRVTLPVLVSVTLCVPVLPTSTPVKFTDAGLIAI